ncbi:MAG: GNAT family N-acetyltransferase [Chloroflexi bacterium]|nr:GNAT family N-acetyltransferase [Chloroflexota bacterium]MBI3168522.1 GNAT family N-acetyltransferase [Chloroflexota bacterium]
MLTEKPLLDLNLKLRATTWADVHTVADLIYAVCEADGDVTVASTPEELDHEWHNNKFNPETDSHVIETCDGRVVAYGEFYNHQVHADLNADLYIHPEFKEHGLFPSMLAWIEARAREDMKLAEPDLRVFIRSTMDGKDEIAMHAHEAERYKPVRFHWRMEINLTEEPPVSDFPAGIELRPFDKAAHARLVMEAENDSFSEHWGSHAAVFDEWSHRKLENTEFDPSLWMIAWDGDQIAGFSQNRFRMGIGWVSTLGVRKQWRKSGLGLALLQHSFGKFYKRGMKTIGLGVDASNKTGATRLYQRAGMSVASEFITFEKEIRSGRALEDANQRE